MEEMKRDIQEHGIVQFPLNTLIHVVRKNSLLDTINNLRLGGSKRPTKAKETKDKKTP